MTTQEIKARLKQKKLSYAALARRWGKSKTTIHFLIERRLTSQRLDKKLARVLGVTPAELNSTEKNGSATLAGEGGGA